MLRSPVLALLCLFFLFSSTALAASAVIGVDLGTEYIKAALVKPGIPLEIVLTKDSRRKEMSAVAFKPAKNIKSGDFPERVYGSDAIALSARFPGDVYPNLKRVLGLGADNSVVKEYASRHPALKLEAEKTRGTAAFRSGAFPVDEEAWMVEEILAMELQSIQKNAEAMAGKDSVIKDLVVTIPPFYTAQEKRAVELAAKLAGLRLLELVSDGLAVGLNYATSRTFPSINEGGKPEYHMVFDMGAGSTKATILRFQGRTVKDVGKFNKTIQEVQVLGSGWDRTLGGDSLNEVIVDDMIAQFVASPKAKSVSPTIEAVQGHGRAAAKLLKEAEKLRQVLSANTNTQASFEGLYEDIDFKYKISRADFEKLAESHAARVGVVVQKALDMADLEVKDLDSIILHGGAIRTPFVQKELEKIVGKSDKLRSNVNSDEAAVFGAGFRGAGLSPSFRVKEIRAFEGATYAAGIKWTNINEKPQHQRLWQPTSYLGAEKQYAFKNQKEFTIDFYQHVPSSENVSPGSAEKELLTLTSQNLTESVSRLKDKFSCTDGDINVRLTTRLSPVNGEVEIVKFVVDCEVDVSEEKESMVDSVKGLFGFGKKDQVPLAEDAGETETVSESSSTTDSSASSSTSSSSTATSSSASAKESKDAKDTKQKQTKRLEVIPLKYTTELKGLPQISTAEIKRMKDRLQSFDDADRSKRLREEALNQLEGFTYKVRDLLDKDEFVAASTKEEQSSLESKSKETSEWIYSGGADASREELKAKLKEMKDIVTPIEFRMEEAATRPDKIKALQDALSQTKQVLAGINEQIKNDTKAHEAFSSSKSAAASATTTAAATSNEFEGLEDEEVTETTSAPVEEETMDPPVYSEADLIRPQAQYDSISKWLDEKLAEQEKLSETADPVLLSKDLTAKAKELTDMHVELIMKSMQRPYKSKRPTTKPKKKPKKTSTKKAKGSKTGSAEKAEKTLDFTDDGMPSFKIGEDGEMPSEEEIMAWIEKEKAKQAAADSKAQKDIPDEEPKTEQMEETDGDNGNKHDEL
ncbi:actin-like ATPase domain-containing protein [Hyaloscypha variabilis F]|uniref:Actin-like ATPase domain-containing protein n=1 Tax=Hyaloscypha variabilis (strain UAMH 11265 / GT02V1 / F) TaxID=1149755 RepID=A0A2J6S5D0_HYAVF|nr:actin-like ATPase domain-containing protein [Hyaloscypha variabilis F]